MSESDYRLVMYIASLFFGAIVGVGGIILFRLYKEWRKRPEATAEECGSPDCRGGYDFSYFRDMRPQEELGSFLSELMGLFFGRIFPLWGLLGLAIALLISVALYYSIAFIINWLISGFAHIKWL